MCTAHGATAPSPLSAVHAEILQLVLEDRSEFISVGDILASAVEVARREINVALAMIAGLENAEASAAARAVIAHPSPDTFNQLMAVSRGERWEDCLTNALAALSIAKASELLNGGGH